MKFLIYFNRVLFRLFIFKNSILIIFKIIYLTVRKFQNIIGFIHSFFKLFLCGKRLVVTNCGFAW